MLRTILLGVCLLVLLPQGVMAEDVPLVDLNGSSRSFAAFTGTFRPTGTAAGVELGLK